ncbi:MAG: sulfotransferase domain-containing protein [Proteobacteria bacterium]|nr:sulfotransferase domain-containing protein [Pseudomonadota bacterium]
MNWFKKRINMFLVDYINRKKMGRDIDYFDDDIFIVSYPKSGNTWMRFIIGNLIYDDFNFKNMEELIPDIYVVPNEILKKYPRPRILKSHEYYHPKYKKVIYIVRDPRSVAVSYYFHLKKFNVLDEKISFQDFLERFLDGTLDNYGTWEENVKSWVFMKNQDLENFLLIKYEDLSNNIEEEVRKVIRFLRLSVSNDKFLKAIEKSKFENMKENEKRLSDETKVLKNTKKDIPFIRSGRIDEWLNYFTENDIRKLKDRFGNTMNAFGYI